MDQLRSGMSLTGMQSSWYPGGKADRARELTANIVNVSPLLALRCSHPPLFHSSIRLSIDLPLPQVGWAVVRVSCRLLRGVWLLAIRILHANFRRALPTR